MATAPAFSPSRTTLHRRGTWNPRDDRTASAVWLGILWVGVLAGFGVDFPRYLRENPPAPFIIHVHAVVFTVWLLLLTAQVLLVVRNRVAWHRNLGWFMTGWAGLMAILGPVAAVVRQIVNAGPGTFDPPFLSVNIVDIVGFLALLAWGIALRKNPAAHRRMMLLSAICVAGDPGFSRFTGWIWPDNPASIFVWFLWCFYGNVLLIGLMAVWDWWRGRLVRSFVIGASSLVAAEVVATLLYWWPPWKALTTAWVIAWARHFG